jgi:osmotically inducible protein OsmC
MPRIERTASVTWEGNVARGTGRISADTGAFEELPFSLPTRIGSPDGKTSPEELLAAAHAGCLAMSLASELSSAGSPPERLDVRATIRMDEVEGQGHQIVASTAEVRARVPGFARDAWEKAVEAADEGCPFSALLRRAGADVKVNAELEEG